MALRKALLILPLAAMLAACDRSQPAAATTREPTTMNSPNPATKPAQYVCTDEEWRSRLTPQQYEVMRQKGTERAFTGKFWNHHEKGVYKCACCGHELFSSDTKFESGTGWPSFWQPIRDGSVATTRDTSHGMVRIEVLCPKCKAHLGHVFDDGPKPTGQRYCINSAALEFEKK